jgi:uncharacterized caspase-like protein
MMTAYLFRKGKGEGQRPIPRTIPRTFLGALLTALLLCVLTMPAAAEKRVALVIGNGKYGGEIGSLVNPPNDANLMADRLGKLGFQVIKLVNGDQKAMKRAISDFGEKLLQAGPDAVGLFFYAGHGVQIGGENYLIPVGAAINKEADADIEAVSADGILRQMEFAGNRVNIVLLDACRNNPLTRSFRGSDRGLARMDAPTGTFIGYSTAPGAVAADGNGKNSPYVAALSEELGQPGIPLEETFRNVRVRVMAETKDQQVPWDSSSLTGAFYFKSGAKVAAAAPAPAAPAKPATNGAEAGATETLFWQSIKDSQDAAEFEAYLARYPNGTFSDLARAKVMRLASGDVASLERTPTAPVAAAPAVANPAPQPEPEVAAPAPAEPEQQAALEPEPEPEPEPAAVAAPSGAIQLSESVAAKLDQYLRAYRQGKAAFAVSRDGQAAGYFICPEVDQCVAGLRNAPQNRDRTYPQKEALRQCERGGGGECVILFLAKEERAAFVRP